MMAITRFLISWTVVSRETRRHSLSTAEAISRVKELPEVKYFLRDHNPAKQVIVVPDDSTGAAWVVHVVTYLRVDTAKPFNRYVVQASTGNICALSRGSQAAPCSPACRMPATAACF